MNQKLKYLTAIGLFPAVIASHYLEIYSQGPLWFYRAFYVPFILWIVSILIGFILVFLVFQIEKKLPKSQIFLVLLYSLLLLIALINVSIILPESFFIQSKHLALAGAGLFLIGLFLMRHYHKRTQFLLFFVAAVFSIVSTGKDLAILFKIEGETLTSFYLKRSNPNLTFAKTPQTPVIHILFDMFSGIPLVNNVEIKKNSFIYTERSGIYFPNAYSNAHYTAESVPQFLTGEFQPKNNSPTLFTESLKNGYQNYIYSEQMVGIQNCRNTAQSCHDSATARENLFHYSAWQTFVTVTTSLTQHYLKRIGVSSVKPYYLNLPKQPPDNSKYFSHANKSIPLYLFNTFLENLSTAPKNSYHYLHILLPHHPNIHDEECRVLKYNIRPFIKVYFEKKSAYLKQMQCANKLVLSLFKRLHELNIYDEALIIIHGDHGTGLGYINFIKVNKDPMANPELIFQNQIENRARSLLWVKPPHHKQAVVNDTPAQLLTLPNTIKKILGWPSAKDDEATLLNAEKNKSFRFHVRHKFADYFLTRDATGIWHD